MAKIESENPELVKRVENYIKKNQCITRETAREIAESCEVSVEQVKCLVIKIKKKMYVLKERGHVNTSSEALDLAVKHIRTPKK